ncbi:MAG: hypothetical protein ACREX4_00570 [Gammaproteobacteria bacterium]
MEVVVQPERYGSATYRDWDRAEWAETHESTGSGNVSMIQWSDIQYIQYNVLIIETAVQIPAEVRIRVEPRPHQSLDTLAKHLEAPTELTPSAFTERESLRINKADIHKIFSGLEANPLIVERARIAARLRKLFEVRVEEEYEHEPMFVDSLRCFVRFLATVPNARYPDIGLSPDGNLVVEWRSDARAKHITEFLPDQRAVVLLILQDAQYPYQYRRITSTVPVGSLRDFLQCNEAIALIEAQPSAK